VAGYKVIDQIERFSLHAIHLDHDTVLYGDAWQGIERAVHRCQADLGPGMNERFPVDGTLGAAFNAFRPFHIATFLGYDISCLASYYMRLGRGCKCVG
jgi:hypothetical protein